MPKDKSPLISVITLSYFSPDLFGAIDSVLNQTYSNIEYIILDDNTPDFDENEIKEYVASHQTGNIKRLIVRKSPSRIGTVKETNIGLSAANGEFVFNLAGDDQFVDPNVLSDWVRAFQETGADVLTAYRDVYDKDLETRFFRMPTDAEVTAIKTLTAEELFEYVEGCNIVFGCCTARSKKNISEMGPIPEDYKLIEDYVFLLRLLRAGKKVVFFDRVVVKYRSGGVCDVSNINREYWEDSDRIFRQEILPFSRNKHRAKWKYARWKNNVLWDKDIQRFHKEKKLANGNKIRIWALRVKYGIKHPIKALKKLFHRV